MTETNLQCCSLHIAAKLQETVVNLLALVINLVLTPLVAGKTE